MKNLILNIASLMLFVWINVILFVPLFLLLGPNTDDFNLFAIYMEALSTHSPLLFKHSLWLFESAL